MAKKSAKVTAGKLLRMRRLGIDTYRENVAYLHRECELYRAEGFQALAKVEICADGRRILAVLNVVDDNSIVKPTELCLSEEACSSLGLDEGSLVSIEHAKPPESMNAVVSGGSSASAATSGHVAMTHPAHTTGTSSR